ncbi:MAG: 4Fe-4S dicluster domain-containing protein [Candidatus Lindowbacteria bacterium]|nr:4Fe-4S dicluster domain-containing protein [Candidatus Lindowbacteria bacterium]
MNQMSILTDVTLCIGCEECVKACKKTNGTGEDQPWRWQRKIDDLSASRWTMIVSRPEKHYVRKQCRHCLEPACASVCPVGAMHKTPEGPVVYNSKICMGCRYCMMACPYGIPRYDWSLAVPYVRKCIMCYDKIKSGELKEPACITACPQKATIYGNREELLQIAHKRIEEKPDLYIHKVYGEHDVGGTSVLYLSDISLDFLGLKKELDDKPLPPRTWAFLKEVPYVFVGVGALMYGAYWVIERRMRLEAEKKGEPRPPAHEEKYETGQEKDKPEAQK